MVTGEALDLHILPCLQFNNTQSAHCHHNQLQDRIPTNTLGITNPHHTVWKTGIFEPQITNLEQCLFMFHWE